MKVLGILLLLASVGLAIFAWAGPLPGGRTVEQVMEKGVWKTVKDMDESRPVRVTVSFAAAGILILGVGLMVYSRRVSGTTSDVPGRSGGPSNV